MLRKCSPGLMDSKKAMAGDTTTELLFLDTFKHQSAEVNFIKHSVTATRSGRHFMLIAVIFGSFLCWC